MSSENIISKKIMADFILNELDSDKEFFSKQLSSFLNHLNEFKKSGDDPIKLSQLAHKIKTGCRCFGAHNFEASMEQIEKLKKNNNLNPNSDIFKQTILLIDPLIDSIIKTSEEIFSEGFQNE